MQKLSPDQMLIRDDWSNLACYHPLPNIDTDRLYNYRLDRLKQEMAKLDVAVAVLLNPVSLRYAINHRNYALFSSHIPCTYLMIGKEGSLALHNSLASEIDSSIKRRGRPIAHFYAGDNLTHFANLFSLDVENYLIEIGANNKRVAVEYVNPSITQALEKRGIEVLDGVMISENARMIKSVDDIDCINWAMKVAELGADKVKQALVPGVTELQLWGLLNYTNLANDGDWHDGRMLASGPRINPWLQEASQRKIEPGDLVGFDTDMVGPMGYFADLSRTFLCGPSKATSRQKELYLFAMNEIEHNLRLIKPGNSFSYIQDKAYEIPEEFRENAYTCIVHGVGMCDEFPHVHPKFRGPPDCDGELRAGMVVCVESYMGAVGERDGVKLEQQVLVTDDGYELLTQYPFEEELM